MRWFWDSFEKRARHIAPPIPGPRLISGAASALPGQGAMVMGRFGLKQAPQTIKSRGVGSTAVP